MLYLINSIICLIWAALLIRKGKISWHGLIGASLEADIYFYLWAYHAGTGIPKI